LGTVTPTINSNLNDGSPTAVNGTPGADELVTIDTTFFGILDNNPVLFRIKNGNAAGKVISTTTGGNIDKVVHINGGDIVWAEGDSSGNVSILTEAKKYLWHDYKTAQEMYNGPTISVYSLTALGTASTDITTGPCADGHLVKSLDASTIEYLVMTFRIPTTYVAGTDIVIGVNYITKNANSSNPAYMHIGGAFSTVPNPGPGTSLNTMTAVFQGEYETQGTCEPDLEEYTFPYSTFGFEAGGMLTVCIVREGSHVDDTYNHDLYIGWVAIGGSQI